MPSRSTVWSRSRSSRGHAARRWVEQPPVELDEEPSPSYATSLDGAATDAHDLAGAHRQPVGSLDEIQVAVLEHRAGPLATSQDSLDEGPAREPGAGTRGAVISRSAVVLLDPQASASTATAARSSRAPREVEDTVLEADARRTEVPLHPSGEAGDAMQHDAVRRLAVTVAIDRDVDRAVVRTIADRSVRAAGQQQRTAAQARCCQVSGPVCSTYTPRWTATLPTTHRTRSPSGSCPSSSACDRATTPSCRATSRAIWSTRGWLPCRRRSPTAPRACG